MKKNLFKKWVSVLGAVLLLANVFLPGLESYAQEIVSNQEITWLVWDYINSADTLNLAVYKNNTELQTALSNFLSEDTKYPLIIVTIPEWWKKGTIVFEYGDDYKYSSETAKAPFGKHMDYLSGYLIQSIPDVFDNNSLEWEWFNLNLFTISFRAEEFTKLNENENWYYVNDEDSFDSAYNDGEWPLWWYYTANPLDDRWNFSENRSANFNDRVYSGIFYDDINADWEAMDIQAIYYNEEYQSIKIWDDTYYLPYDAEIWNDDKIQLYSSFDCSLNNTTLPDDATYPDSWKNQWVCSYYVPAKVEWNSCILPDTYYNGAYIDQPNNTEWCVYKVDGVFTPTLSDKYIELLSFSYPDCVPSWNAADHSAFPWIIWYLNISNPAIFEWKYEEWTNPKEWASIEENAVISNSYWLISPSARFGNLINEPFAISKFSAKLITSEWDLQPLPITYHITLDQASNWTISSDVNRAKEWDTVTLTATPTSNYNFTSWTVKDADNNTITVTENKFTMPAKNVTVSATFTAKSSVSSSSGGWSTWGGGSTWGSSASNSSSSSTTTTSNPTSSSSTDIIEFKWEVTDDNTNTANSDNKPAVIISDKARNDYKPEQIEAYIWAYENWITTINDIEKARLKDSLTRAELAKMMSQYISSVLKKSPIKADLPGYRDVNESLGDLADYIVKAYQYQIMGIDADGNALEYFYPNNIVTRAEFGTVFSRVLYWSVNNQKDGLYYEKHLAALKEAGILTNDNPTMEEVRGWVMIMMYRSVNPQTPAEETDNKETTDTNTGSVAEVTTWATAEAVTGNVAEATTGAIVEAEAATTWAIAEATTWAVAADAANDTTGAVAEATTGSTAEVATGTVNE